MSWYTVKPKWYLMQWKAIVKNRDNLNEFMQQSAKMLFASLKELSKEDVQLLHEKYFEATQGTNYNYLLGDYSKYTPDSDREIAKRKGIPIKDYTKARVGAEERMKAVVNRLSKEFKEAEAERLERYVLKLGRLYLKDYRIASINRLDPSHIVFTQNIAQAKIFEQASKEGEEIMRGLRLQKASPGEDVFFYNVYLD